VKDIWALQLLLFVCTRLSSRYSLGTFFDNEYANYPTLTPCVLIRVVSRPVMDRAISGGMLS
jgi:hypothetical protein